MDINPKTGGIVLNERDRLILQIDQAEVSSDLADELVERAQRAHSESVEALIRFYYHGEISPHDTWEELSVGEAMMHGYSIEVAEIIDEIG